jgi:hypothetical protein
VGVEKCVLSENHIWAEKEWRGGGLGAERCVCVCCGQAEDRDWTAVGVGWCAPHCSPTTRRHPSRPHPLMFTHMPQQQNMGGQGKGQGLLFGAWRSAWCEGVCVGVFVKQPSEF